MHFDASNFKAAKKFGISDSVSSFKLIWSLAFSSLRLIFDTKA